MDVHPTKNGINRYWSIARWHPILGKIRWWKRPYTDHGWVMWKMGTFNDPRRVCLERWHPKIRWWLGRFNIFQWLAIWCFLHFQASLAISGGIVFMRCRRLGTLVSPWRNWHVDVVIEARASLFWSRVLGRGCQLSPMWVWINTY